jgi:hypothetical protein
VLLPLNVQLEKIEGQVKEAVAAANDADAANAAATANENNERVIKIERKSPQGGTRPFIVVSMQPLQHCCILRQCTA